MADVVKYGIQIPNRVFVGGVAFDTKEDELKQFFQQYGKVKDCKIVTGKDGFSKGYAFVTFESKQEAIQTQKLGTVFFKQKKLNLGPAIRQKGVVFNGNQEEGNEPVAASGLYISPNGYCYTVAPNGVWYFHHQDAPNENGTPVNISASTPGNLPVPPDNVPVHVPRTIPSEVQSRPEPSVNRPHPQPHPPLQRQVSNPVPVTFVPAGDIHPTIQLNNHYNQLNDHYNQQHHYTLVSAGPSPPEPSVGYFPPDVTFIPYYAPQHPAPQLNYQVAPQPPPPPPPPPQGHPVQHPFHLIPAGPLNHTRPEIYQIVTSPVDPCIVERGPFIIPDNVMNRAPQIRPSGPIKRIAAKIPPFTLHRKNSDNTRVPSSQVNNYKPTSRGSTPGSSSSAGESGPEKKE